MSKSTPADLAVAFRSLRRRRDEALEAAKGAPVGSLLAELDESVAAAAAVAGSASARLGRRDARRPPPARHRRRVDPSPHHRIGPTGRRLGRLVVVRLGVQLDDVLDHGAIDRVDQN